MTARLTEPNPKHSTEYPKAMTTLDDAAHTSLPFDLRLADYFDANEPQTIADVAAALAFTSWESQPVAHAAEELCEAVQTRLPADAGEPLDIVSEVLLAATTHGALLGFYLGQTSAANSRGWGAWLAAARAELEQAGYHLSDLGIDTARLASDIRKIAETVECSATSLS